MNMCGNTMKDGVFNMMTLYRNIYKNSAPLHNNVNSHRVKKSDKDEIYKILISEEIVWQCILPFESALSETIENSLIGMVETLERGLFKKPKHKGKEKIYG